MSFQIFLQRTTVQPLGNTSITPPISSTCNLCTERYCKLQLLDFACKNCSLLFLLTMVYKFHAHLEAGIQNIFSYFTSTQRMILAVKVKHWVVFLPHSVSSFLYLHFVLKYTWEKWRSLLGTGREKFKNWQVVQEKPWRNTYLSTTLVCNHTIFFLKSLLENTLFVYNHMSWL